MALLYTEGTGPATVRGLVDWAASTWPDRIFLLNPETGVATSFAVLRLRAIELSSRLAKLSLPAGAKIAFMLDNGPGTAELLLSLAYAGFVAVPLNVAAGSSQLAYVLGQSDAEAVFVSQDYLPGLREALGQVDRSLPVLAADSDRGPRCPDEAPETCPLAPVSSGDDALLVYTSGSTGRPRGVLVSQRSLIVNGLNTARAHELTPEDRSLCVLPLYHMNAQVVTLMSTLVSGGSVAVPRRFTPSRFWRWVGEHRCTWFALVPTIVAQLLSRGRPSAEEGGFDVGHVRFARSSSAPLAASELLAFEEEFGLPMIEAMGLTEAGGAVFSNPLPPRERKPGSPGIPYGFDAKVVDDEGRELGPNEEGEILIRGECMMKCYYKQPEATAEVLTPDGWLRTGDIGRRDGDGYFFITGRAKEIILKGGENIAPREIDDALLKHPAVLEAACAGVSDPVLGEDIVAYVVLKPGQSADEAELAALCEREVGEFRTPSRFHFVDDLPRGPSGKVQRLRLVAMADPHKDAVVVASGETAQGFVAPRTPVEEAVAQIWRECLDLDEVGVYDDFFDLNGYSLLAVQVLSRLRDRFGVSLTLRSFFEHPNIAAQAMLIDDALLRRAPEHAPRATDAGIPVRAKPGKHYPLSGAQRGVWFLTQLATGSSFYNAELAVRLAGPLDMVALGRTVSEIVRRHEALRSTFPVVDGEPVQVVRPPYEVPLPVLDLTDRPETEREPEATKAAQEMFALGFDLTAGPLVRFRVLRLDEDDHVFLASLHHMVCDGWSIGLLRRELSALYTAFQAGQASPLPELPIQYADYVLWEQEHLGADAVSEQLRYWLERLGGDLHALDLPADRPRPPVLSFRGASEQFHLPDSVCADVRQSARRHAATPFMVLLAAFQVLLHRYTGQDDITVGSPVASRNHSKVEGLIGFFANTLALRTDLSGDPTFGELLGRVRETALGAYANQDVPFQRLVEELRPARDPSRTPIFQVAINLRNYPSWPLDLPGVESRPFLVGQQTAKFDLTMFIEDEADGLACMLEYSTDLFDADTIRRMLGHFQVLLASAVSDEKRHLSELPLMTPEERERALVEWNRTEREYGADLCVHRHFERQVERHAGATAVVDLSGGGGSLTYDELNGGANRLAHWLIAQGVGPDTVVGVCLERSARMIVALLGVLKSGGAYLPLEPDDPQPRLAAMLSDARSPLVLTQESLLARLPADGPRPVCLDEDWDQIARCDDANPAGAADPDGLAYVIYTSGSTGAPKGVAVPHRAVTRLVVNTDYVQLGPGDAVAQASNAAFDAATFEIWGPLLNGARTIVVPKETILSPRRFAACAAEQGITTVFLTTALFNAFAREAPAAFAGIREVLFGGEACDPRCVRTVLEGEPPERLLHVYGPTETTTFASWYLVEDVPEGAVSVPIGRPIANTQLYVLDGHRQPVPVGVPAELYVGGPGLARGYLNDSALTNERFVPHPFAAEQGRCLYRTGDTVRRLADGNIEFIGRADNQVKVRGFRVEVGEVEAALRRHPGVEDAAVVAHEDQGGGRRLTAFVVPAAAQAPSEAGLEGFLRETMPSYMVPAAFTVVDALPLTSSGKVDRQALASAASAAPGPHRASAEPRDLLESELVQLYEQVLEVDGVGIRDSFFELGGHSLLAARMFARIEDTLGVSLPVVALFQAPTVEQLADLVRREGWHGPSSPMVATQPRGTRRPLFLVAPASVGTFGNLARHLGRDQPLYALRPFGLLDEHKRLPPVESLASLYIEHVRTVQPEGPYLLGGLSGGGVVAYEMAQQLLARGEEVGRLILLDTYFPRPSVLSADMYMWRLRMRGRLRRLAWLGGPPERPWLVRMAIGGVRGVLTVLGLRRGRTQRLADRSRRRTADLGASVQKVLAAQGASVRRYVPKPYPRMLTLFLASGTRVRRSRDPRRVWETLATGGVKIYEVPGAHHYCMREPHVAVVAETLLACLADVQGNEPAQRDVPG